jgi:hypothetical protein
LSVREARTAIADTSWDAANGVLYDLCRRHLGHNDVAINIAKVWLIGRTYAVAIERNATSRYKGDAFYTHVVGPGLKNSDIDAHIRAVKGSGSKDVALALAAHAALVKAFWKMSKHAHPSLASKYLHFHCPAAVYIYDSRADRAIRYLTRRTLTRRQLGDVTGRYPRFVARCELFRRRLEDKLGEKVTTRDVDKVLLAVAGRVGRA